MIDFAANEPLFYPLESFASRLLQTRKPVHAERRSVRRAVEIRDISLVSQIVPICPLISRWLTHEKSFRYMLAATG